MRQEQSKPLLDQIKHWAETVKPLGESALGNAVKYMANHWSGLVRFVDDANLPLDNNATERALPCRRQG